MSDCAVRLYAVLLRYGQTSGSRMPGRAALARRLRKQSTDTVDRAMKELAAIGTVVVEHRYDGRQQLTNRYHLRTARPGRTAAATRTHAAEGGRISAAGVAAPVRHNPESLTQTPPTQTPPPPPAGRRGWEEEQARFLAECGITDLDGLVARVHALRRDVGQSPGRWTGPCLVAALQAAVRARGWPADRAAAALLTVAADRATRSPMRVAEAGPWWDDRPVSAADDDGEIASLEAELDAYDGLRVLLQRQARAQLAAEGVPATRATVIRRAHALLLARTGAA